MTLPGRMSSETLNDAPHAAPQVAMARTLAPVEAAWFDRSAADICGPLRDSERKGGHDMLAMATHLDHDLVLHGARNPGGGREPAPFGLQAHVDDILMWGVAEMPCPEDE